MAGVGRGLPCSASSVSPSSAIAALGPPGGMPRAAATPAEADDGVVATSTVVNAKPGGST